MTESPRELMIVAGEASGDDHAASLFRHLKISNPGFSAYGLAGDEMIAAGVEPVGHASSIAVVGLVEAFKVLRVARGLFNRLISEAEHRRTRVAVLVDSPGFNLRLARALHRRGVRVLYYISPQLWAWRAKRVETIREYVDQVLVLFDFEVDWYRKHGIEAIHVGHPLVDSVPLSPGVWDRTPTSEGIPDDVVISFMPGSRRSEIDRLLPEMVGAAERISEEMATSSLPIFRIICARNIDRQSLIGPFVDAGIDVEVVTQDRYAALSSSHLVICASGTATLEVGLLDTPMIVVYKLQPLTHVLARQVVKTGNVSLVNLVLREEVVPELLQGEASASRIGEVALGLLEDRERIEEMRSRLGGLRTALGDPGASERAAMAVARAIEETTIVAAPVPGD